jgi:hypothetical protein
MFFLFFQSIINRQINKNHEKNSRKHEFPIQRNFLGQTSIAGGSKLSGVLESDINIF